MMMITLTFICLLYVKIWEQLTVKTLNSERAWSCLLQWWQYKPSLEGKWHSVVLTWKRGFLAHGRLAAQRLPGNLGRRDAQCHLTLGQKHLAHRLNRSEKRRESLSRSVSASSRVRVPPQSSGQSYAGHELQMCLDKWPLPQREESECRLAC